MIERICSYKIKKGGKRISKEGSKSMNYGSQYDLNKNWNVKE